MEPPRAAASSLKMSPNRFPVRITSNCMGRSSICMAALSTYKCSSVILGYWRATRVTVLLQSADVASTLALSTLVTCRFRAAARWNA